MGRQSFLQFLRSHLRPLPTLPNVDMGGQTVLITGANTGLGFESAKHFARMDRPPAKIILACRNQAKAEVATAEIERDTQYTGVEVGIVDFASFASVVAFADKLEAAGLRLDVLICNAAIGPWKYEPSTDGWELSLQVNHLSAALLAFRLLPRLLSTAREFGTTPRLVFVSSNLHMKAIIPLEVTACPCMLEKLSDASYCRRFRVMVARYKVTKLLNVLHTRALAAHLAPSSPLVTCATNPGLCVSNLRRTVPFPLSLVTALMDRLIARSGAEGAKNIVWAALAPDPAVCGPDALRGRYVSDCQIREEGDWTLGSDGRACEARIWEETIEVLVKVDPKVRAVVDEFLLHEGA